MSKGQGHWIKGQGQIQDFLKNWYWFLLMIFSSDLNQNCFEGLYWLGLKVMIRSWSLGQSSRSSPWFPSQEWFFLLRWINLFIAFNHEYKGKHMFYFLNNSIYADKMKNIHFLNLKSHWLCHGNPSLKLNNSKHIKGWHKI